MAIYGFNSIGATGWWSCEVRYCALTVTLASTETAVKLSAYLRSQGSATNGLKMALYETTGDTLSYESSVLSGFTDTSGAWRDFTFTSSVAAGTYRIVVIGDAIAGGGNTVEVAYDTVGADASLYQEYFYGGTWPTLDADLSGAEVPTTTRKASVYLETSSGGGSTINAATIIPQLNRRKTGRFF